jgi:hypothetical protein
MNPQKILFFQMHSALCMKQLNSLTTLFLCRADAVLGDTFQVPGSVCVGDWSLHMTYILYWSILYVHWELSNGHFYTYTGTFPFLSSTIYMYTHIYMFVHSFPAVVVLVSVLSLVSSLFVPI